MRLVSRGVVKARAQALADVVNDPNITTAQLDGLFDVHFAAYYDLLATTGAQADFFFSKTSLTTTIGQSDYQLSLIAPDLLSLVNVYAVEASGILRPIFPFTDKQLGMFRPPQAAWPLRLEYIPCAPTFIDDSQVFDGVDGWDVHVSALMARDILQQRKQSVGVVAAIIAAAEARITKMASKRLRGGPKYLEDVEATGMFFPPTVRINGFRVRGGNLELYELNAIGWP